MNRYEIDPDTGLKLSEVIPAPAMRAADPMAANPVPPPPPLEASPQPSLNPNDVPSENRPAGKISVLDGIIYALRGKPDAMKTDDERAQDSRSRQEAGAMAAAAAEGDPGSQFMGTPSGGSSDFGGDVLKTLVKMFSGGASV